MGKFYSSTEAFSFNMCSGLDFFRRLVHTIFLTVIKVIYNSYTITLEIELWIHLAFNAPLWWVKYGVSACGEAGLWLLTCVWFDFCTHVQMENKILLLQDKWLPSVEILLLSGCVCFGEVGPIFQVNVSFFIKNTNKKILRVALG